MGKVAYICFAFIAVMCLFVIGLAPEVVSLFAPAAYREAIWVIPPVIMSSLFVFMYHFFAPFEFYYKKTSLIAVATCGGAILNIVLNYFFIGIYGYVAAGYTTLVCYIAYALFHFLFMNHICRKEHNGQYPYNAMILLSMSLILLVLGFAFTLTYQNTPIRYGIIASALFTMILFRKKIRKTFKDMIAVRESVMNDKKQSYE